MHSTIMMRLHHTHTIEQRTFLGSSLLFNMSSIFSYESSNTLDLIDESIQVLPDQSEWEWKSVSLAQIKGREWSDKNFHLYLTDLLVKAHNPSLLFENLRKGLAPNQHLAFRISTAENIKNQVKNKYPALLFKAYYFFHFAGRRVLPKVKGLRKISRLLNIPVDMSKSEIMGRLIYHGFEIVDIQETLKQTLFVTRLHDSVAPSTYAKPPSEGLLFSMKRMGKHNKPITVYKFRSMHPYAEYAQAYLHRTNGLDIGGKFKDDYRVSTGGRLIRKYWIDEIPMLYNLVRGDIKLIGVRPISPHYFSLYPEKLQTLRGRHKPGLLPPFYADLPKGFDEIVQSELNYLEAYEKAPLKTDLAYLGKIIKNIIYHKVRSK